MQTIHLAAVSKNITSKSELIVYKTVVFFDKRDLDETNEQLRHFIK
jgi:hypothetical protein